MKNLRSLSVSSFTLCVGLALGLVLFLPASLSAQQLPLDSNQSEAASLMAQQVDEMQKVVDRWDEALLQHDQYALELVLAPQFIDIADNGEVTNRDQQVSEMLAKDAPHVAFSQKVVSVRMVGDTAVINGTYQRTFSGSRLNHIKATEDRGVFSQVYVRTRNGWQCINSQRTIIQPVALTAKNKAKDASEEKPLSHDLGFQLPGFHSSSSNTQQP